MTETVKNFVEGEFLPLPVGDYLLRMNRFEEKATKAGNGKLISASFQIVNGEYKNRLIFHNFLVEHTSAKAQEIGTEQLDRYLKAVGVEGGLEGIDYDRTQLENYTELPFIATLKIEEAKEYAPGKISKARNNIVKFMAR